MLFALSTGHQIGLATTGAVFIVFSLVSSFVLPARYPNFPGERRNLYLVISVLFFAAMMYAVLVFGLEKKTNESAAGGGESALVGDPAAGKALFASSGCGACHTYKPAASAGKVGPSLDNVTADAAAAHEDLKAFLRESITDPNADVAKGFQPGVMPASTATPQQVADLVAFLSSES
jgi:cytochrome c551/c552